MGYFSKYWTNWGVLSSAGTIFAHYFIMKTEKTQSQTAVTRFKHINVASQCNRSLVTAIFPNTVPSTPAHAIQTSCNWFMTLRYLTSCGLQHNLVQFACICIFIWDPERGNRNCMVSVPILLIRLRVNKVHSLQIWWMCTHLFRRLYSTLENGCVFTPLLCLL